MSQVTARLTTELAAAKHGLLAEPKVQRRVATLRSILRKILDDEAATRIFLPPFSPN